MAINGFDKQLTGRVVSVNEKGLKFEGAGEWCNVSKYATGVVLPEQGTEVTVTLDKAGFIRAVQSVDGSDIAPPRSGAHNAPSGQHRDRVLSEDTSRRITRLAVLKAAAEYAASKPDSKSTDVLKIAACWERWVLRDDEPTADLVDAF